MPTMAIGSSAGCATVGAGADTTPISGAEQLGVEMAGERGRSGMVEDQGGLQPSSGRRAQPVAQFHGGERVEAEFLERPLRGHRFRAAVAEHGRRLPADQVEQSVEAFVLRQLRETVVPTIVHPVGRARKGAGERSAHEAAQQGGHRLGGR
ncbi:hypothetical protein SANTM175S_05201 [Streptomyces antimycoticus]